MSGDPKLERDLAMAQHGWKRECADADELLRLMFPDHDADEFRTDGGSINLPKVRHAYGVASRERTTQPRGPGSVKC